jgi:phosphoribosylformylglycinamidine cyclo-ligase
MVRKNTLSYKKVGVDINKIKHSQSEIGRIIRSTYNVQSKVRVAHGFGHYAGIVKILPNGMLLATHTDGVGTKAMIANLMKKYDSIGIDCIAMNVNDVICIGATPISFVDYIAANKNDQVIFKKIMQGLVKGAKKSQVPIVGGETAIMPDLFGGNKSKFSFDLAGTVVGIISSKKHQVLGDKIKAGDVIIGAKSTGIHSNGYTLARKALLGKYSVKDSVRGVGNLGKALLEPTEIYVKPVLDSIAKCDVHGLAHITGGSFTKLLRLKKNVGYVIDSLPSTPPIMHLIEEQGVKEEEMYKTFNMGIGFCIIAPKDNVARIQHIFKKYKIGVKEIGKITSSSKKGVFVNEKKIA